MGRSAAMFFEPYSNDPGEQGHAAPRSCSPKGAEGAAAEHDPGPAATPTLRPGNLEKLLEQAARTGLPPHVHAIGDKAATASCSTSTSAC